MRRDTYFRLIRGELGGPLGVLGRAVLRVLSWGFSAGARLRGMLFDLGIKRVHHPGVPVISVGNLTTGGTGKTPLVIWLAELLHSQGLTVGVLSRGYHAEPGEVSDETTILLEAVPEVVAIQNPDRVVGAQEAIRRGAQVLVLDDGFQHRRIARDLDLVLVSALDPDGVGGLLPRGLLREPLCGMRRADMVLLTHADQVSAEQLAAARALVEREAPQVSLIEARHLVGPLGTDAPLFAFCGLGSPASFLETLRQLGAELTGHRLFDDHHPYTSADLVSMVAEASAQGAEALVTTCKDRARIGIWPGPLPLVTLELSLGFSPTDRASLCETISRVAPATKNPP